MQTERFPLPAGRELLAGSSRRNLPACPGLAFNVPVRESRLFPQFPRGALMILRRFSALLLAGAVLFLGFATVTAQEKKEDKKSEEGRKGTVTGLVTAKGPNLK